MTGSIAWSLALGLLLGSGLWLCFVRLPALRRVKFSDRISGQLRPAANPSGTRPGQVAAETPLGPLVKILWPVLKDLVTMLNRFNPAGGGIQRRLQRAGLVASVTEYRISQLTYAGAGLLLGSIFVVASAARGNFNGVLAITVLLIAGVAGFAFREW
ncbi:MAG: type II secretion system protein F, partial [Micrococcaceae bacterium]|nr:type II secretion system protein F [Micrococcaceae bacterium]